MVAGGERGSLAWFVAAPRPPHARTVDGGNLDGKGLGRVAAARAARRVEHRWLSGLAGVGGGAARGWCVGGDLRGRGRARGRAGVGERRGSGCPRADLGGESLVLV